MSDTQTENRTSDTPKKKIESLIKYKGEEQRKSRRNQTKGKNIAMDLSQLISDLDTERLTKRTGKARQKRAEICSSRHCPMHNDGGPTTVLQSLSLSRKRCAEDDESV
jgi:hypothetical protein